MTEIPTRLLLFTCIIQGIQSIITIEYKESVTAVVGQEVELPCTVPQTYEMNINQLEWRRADKKLVVFNPAYPINYWADVKLKLINRTDTNKLRGSILILSNVSKNNAGDYICDITTFPNGSIKRITSVHITDPKILMEVMPSSTLIEGDMVNVTCRSHPPADRYRLWSSQIHVSLESQDGDFTIQNVTRQSGSLTCQPLWNSSSQHLQNLMSTNPLTVDFLDSIECSSSSHIEVDTGINLTITCDAKSSRPLRYVWMKGNSSVSSDVTLSLWSVNTGDSGIYTLTINARNHSRLHRQKNFNVTVLSRTHTEHMETSQTSRTTLTTGEPGPELTTSQSGHVSGTAYTSTAKGPYATSPPAGSNTTLQANITTQRSDVTNTTTASEGSSREGCCKWQNATSSPVSPQRGLTRAHVNTSIVMDTSMNQPGFTQEGSKNSQQKNAVYFLIPLILLLVLIGFLTRRFIIQKRMDMPPSFKPPPPPVKYTSVIDHNIKMTDILV
ncbi:nectin-4 [Brachyhypopomus gauderio]|uniref:nectin-4 n=1 Tax=Brachyhypopomus gauderio TaxID=698409 RepID=UPI004040F759